MEGRGGFEESVEGGGEGGVGGVREGLDWWEGGHLVVRVIGRDGDVGAVKDSWELWYFRIFGKGGVCMTGERTCSCLVWVGARVSAATDRLYWWAGIGQGEIGRGSPRLDRFDMQAARGRSSSCSGTVSIGRRRGSVR